ncbi:MAG: DUF433 domain-containing protein [Planctomycetia bacterium]|nr:DUF433 domain-containing protein [Planctomycetia bacterium]
MSSLMTEYISIDPAICGGKPCIAGTRIRVQDIFVLHELQGLGVDEIVEGYPQLTPAKVYAALAFYWDHKEEIDQHMQSTQDLVEKLKLAQGSSALQRKMANHRGSNG